jgi:glycosyltransferase involved in cell wall biosynthesis
VLERLISIVLPVHNQADHIEEVVQEYLAALARVSWPHELILVVNGCRDASWEICQALSTQHPTVRALKSEKGAWGLAVARSARAHGDCCVTRICAHHGPGLTLLLLYAIVWPEIVIKANRKIREQRRRRLASLQPQCRALFDLSMGHQRDAEGVSANLRQAADLVADDDLIDANS